MKRSTLIKRMTRKQRRATLPRNGVREIAVQTEEKARELQRVSNRLEDTQRLSREETAHLARLAEKRKKEETARKEAITDATLELERLQSKCAEAERREGAFSKKVKSIQRQITTAQGRLAEAKKDEMRAEVAGRKRKREETRFTAAKRKATTEERRIAKLKKQFADAQHAYEVLVEKSKEEDGKHKKRSTAFEVARKRLSLYGKRLKTLYEQKGMPLPEEIIRLPDSL